MEQKLNNFHAGMVNDTIVEAILLIEGLAVIENGKTIDGNDIKARLAQKYDFDL